MTSLSVGYPEKFHSGYPEKLLSISALVAMKRLRYFNRAVYIISIIEIVYYVLQFQ